jgi:predicted metal-dependent phosphoesterase TrpH
MKADLHAHTHFSRDALTSVSTFARRYAQAGIDCVAVSDHNNIDGALAVRSEAAFRVIVSEEIKSSEGEIIGLFLQETIRKGLTPEDTVRAIREQGGLVLIPHPYDRVRRSPRCASCRTWTSSRCSTRAPYLPGTTRSPGGWPRSMASS